MYYFFVLKLSEGRLFMAKKIINQMANDYVDGVITLDDNDTIKQVIKNIYVWATNGKTQSEIANYLTLNKKEWNELVSKYPEALGAFAKGKEFANTLLSMSMFEMAMGKQTFKRQVSTKEGIVWLEEEIPPNVRFNALKFLLENQVPQVYGKHQAMSDQNEYAKVLATLSDAEKQALMLIEKKETIKTLEIQRKPKEYITEDGEVNHEE
jgi:hypothetical protein